MMTEEQLKGRLLESRQQEFPIPPEEERPALLDAMLAYIGSPDQELRDHLIYPAFWHWILKKPAFSKEQLRRILAAVLGERHIFWGLGEPEGDRVFTRAFSMLLLPLLLIAHRNEPYLSAKEVRQAKEAVLRYLPCEQDRRGYVDDFRGWAHSVAHCADALDDLALATELGRDDLLEILAAIQAAASDNETIYTFGEEDRLTQAVTSVVSRELIEEAAWRAWVLGFKPHVEKFDVQKRAAFMNTRRFLKALFYACHERNLPPWLAQVVMEALKR